MLLAVALVALSCNSAPAATSGSRAPVQVTAGVNGQFRVGGLVDVSMDLHNGSAAAEHALLSISPAWSENHTSARSSDCRLAAASWDCGSLAPGEWRVVDIKAIASRAGAFSYEVRAGPSDRGNWTETIS
jgi:hypothetical protein